ncbi:MAG: succinylglutamate desuccinylase/aspartoacylase family protein, partial [Gammaproteobacteria bacterium]|nr:succinylglutamate desuccinylase/aspartoacylase family protein [Gammaproteobacteria bacterium]
MTRDIQYPVELTPPDLSPYRQSNTGIDYLWTFESGRPGPHAMLSAVVHGNELCGAIVLDELMRAEFRPRVGRLTMGFVNIAAYRRFDHRHPLTSRYVDEDFNRLWSESVLSSNRVSAELNRARALQPIVASADYLLDIHSMQHPTEALGLAGPADKGRDFARAIGFPRLIVTDAGHAAGTRMRDYAGFAAAGDAKNAMLVECGQHWAPSSVDVARTTTLRFLRLMEMLDQEAAARVESEPVEAQTFIEITDPITVRNNEFNFVDDYRGMEVIETA